MPLPDPRLDHLLSNGTPRLEPLLRWLLDASSAHSVDGEARRTARLRRLHAALASRGLSGPMSESWNHASAIRLLAETGLPDRTTLLGEGFLRVVNRIIPRLDPEGDLYALLDRLDLGQDDAVWIEGLPRGPADRLGGLAGAATGDLDPRRPPAGPPSRRRGLVPGPAGPRPRGQ